MYPVRHIGFLKLWANSCIPAQGQQQCVKLVWRLANCPGCQHTGRRHHENDCYDNFTLTLHLSRGQPTKGAARVSTLLKHNDALHCAQLKRSVRFSPRLYLKRMSVLHDFREVGGFRFTIRQNSLQSNRRMMPKSLS